MLVGRAMGPVIVRSSLEVMLDTLRQKEEKPKDSMPALPARPVSRGRLPPSRRPLQVNFGGHNNELGCAVKKELSQQEETGQQTLRGVIIVQKHFRGVKARREFLELKNGVTPLQSFVRGCLARKHLNGVRNMNVSKVNPCEEQTDAYKEQLREAHEAMKELQNRALKAEAALKDKEDENLTLKQQLQQYESKRSDYEMKIKSIEEMWQQRMTSLQISLAEAKRSLAADSKAQSQQELLNTPQYNHNFDSEDTSQEFQTPDSTPAKQLRASATVLPISSNNNNSTQNAVCHMVKEFERKTKDFEDDAKSLVEAKAGNPDEEIQKLKIRFANWKKDYKIKLREAKVELHKHGNLESVRTRKKWWSLRSAK